MATDESPFRVLLVAKGFPPVAGGVETYSLEVARAYMRAGAKVDVITQTEGSLGWSTRDFDAEGKLRVYNTGPGSQFATALRLYRAIRREVILDTYRFVHATTWRPAIVLPRRINRKLVLSVHGREVLRVPKWMRPLVRNTLNRGNLILTVSSETMRRARSAGLVQSNSENQWIVSGNGISYPNAIRKPFRPSSPQSPLSVLTVARLVARKNLVAAIRSITRAGLSDGSSFHYQIAGKGPSYAELEAEVQRLDASSQVTLLGYVSESDVVSLYSSADIFLHPQVDEASGEDFEGFGISIADAMAFGCAVIVGAGSGPADFVFDGVNGLVVDGRNEAEITAALISLSRNDALRERLGNAAYEYAHKNLSWDSHVAQIVAREFANEPATS